jgi:hypothetical protein
MASIGQNPLVIISPSHVTGNSAYTLFTGVTISTEPSAISAVENPIIYQFASDIINNTTSLKARICISYPSGPFVLPTTGTYFTLSASTPGNFPTFTITAAAEPGANECYSIDTLPVPSATELGLQIAATLNANFAFRQRFYASSVLGLVVIEALDYGSHWNIEFCDFGTTWGVAIVSPPLNNQTAPDILDSESRKDYGIWADLFIDGVGDFGNAIDKTDSIRVTQEELSFDRNNEYYFDVAGALKNYVSTPLPSLSGTSMETMNEALVNYYMVFGSIYDEFGNDYRRQFIKGQTSVAWAMNSSLPLNDYNTLLSYTFDNALTSQFTNFLTNQPSTKITHQSGHEYLSILYSNSNGAQLSNLAFTVIIDVFYGDGSTDLNFFEIMGTLIPSNGGGLYCIDVSPFQIFGSSLVVGGLLVTGYRVKVIKSPHNSAPQYVASTTQSYRFSLECKEQKTQLFWVNPLGGWDTFIFAGNEKLGMDRKVTTFTMPLSYAPTVQDKVNIIDKIDINKTFTVYSEYIDREHFEWLFEIGKSSDVRIKVGDNLIPIIITKVSDYSATNTDDMWQVAIEYRYSVDENYIKQ